MNSIPFSINLLADLQKMFQFEFMQHAFEAGTIVAIIAGIVGYFVVLRRSSFAAHALAHIGFAGAAGAVLFGIRPVFGLLLSTSVSGFVMAILGSRAAHRDTQIGIVLAFMLGMGVLFISLYTGYATEAYSILFGEILGISSNDALLTLVAGSIILAAVAVVYRPLLFSSLDEEVAEAKGMPVLLLGIIFMLLVAVAASIAVQVVGVLLIFSLMVTPAATAQRLAKRPQRVIIISVVIALMATWLGLFISFYEPYPVSFFITSIVFVFYLFVRFVYQRIKPKKIYQTNFQ
ncbi:metal ABC transporter permease [Candidatus Nitrosotalea bavarica]|uniref:metal ABC transporter permease n=1 Tax=Candidatus Nitrosotalea bavarica TaxID=1903277 RepID=UPI000C701020|nr:metal ABC transporter permease [Candidatus Nitrosotalea bavarica]